MKRLDKSWKRQALNAFNRCLSVALPLSVAKEPRRGGRAGMLDGWDTDTNCEREQEVRSRREKLRT